MPRLVVLHDAAVRLMEYCRKRNMVDKDGKVEYRDILAVAVMKHINDLERIENGNS